MRELIKRFEPNTVGRDFVVGDIHGMYYLLIGAMQDVDFDVNMDRLFSVGDLVDRGSQSLEVVELLKEPWFHTIRGNHEQMALSYWTGDYPEYHYISNGGRWFVDLDRSKQDEIVLQFSRLPYAFEIEKPNGEMVGIIHADIELESWSLFKTSLENRNENTMEYVLWGRDRLKSNTIQNIEGVSKVYCGHTPVKDVKCLGNFWFVDVGSCFYNQLKLVEI